MSRWATPITRGQALIGFSLLGAALAITLALGIVTYVEQQNTNSNVVTLANQHHNDSTRQSDANRTLIKDIGSAQHEFAVSQKASTATRVSTVTQRCKLTALTIAALRRIGDLTDVAAFQKSLTDCETQLKAVKAINAATPNP